jgi:hypothetical protein
MIVLLFAGLFLLSIRMVRYHKKNLKFIYQWGFLFGAFVWEDLLVFSFYGLITSLITHFLESYRMGLLFFLVFWAVRSGGEAIYFFLQQFVEPKHFPHYVDAHFRLFRRILGPLTYQQCLILMQIIFQIVLMSSIIGLILLTLYWHQLP